MSELENDNQNRLYYVKNDATQENIRKREGDGT